MHVVAAAHAYMQGAPVRMHACSKVEEFVEAGNEWGRGMHIYTVVRGLLEDSPLIVLL